jgi:hypothetical protein
MRRAIAYACSVVGCSAALALPACGDVKQGGQAKTCVKAYEQCVLPSGVLGVCNPVDCAQGQPEPCLICRSQH